MKVCLVGCGDRKRPGAAEARDLYTSPAFANRRRIAEREGDQWFILSGLHGLLEPEQVVEPYNVDLGAATREERRRWSAQVVDELQARFGGDMNGMTFEVLAPTAYCAFGLKEGLERLEARVEWPVEGMKQFEQQAYYARRAGGEPEDAQPVGDAVGVSPTYRPLFEFLRSRADPLVTLHFHELEKILGRALPPSARKYSAWWSGSVVRSAIKGAGWSAGVDFDRETVAFRRSGSPPSGMPSPARASVDRPREVVGIAIDIRLVREAVTVLTDISQAEPAATFPTRGQEVVNPGLYSWWADTEARQVIGEVLQVEVPALIYAGQAGAGTSADLRQRILGTHIGGRIIRSTFRLTLAALLSRHLSLALVGPEKLSEKSEAALTQWIKQHLSVAVFPYADRATLRSFEEAVIREIDAPLNLSKMVRGEVRARLSELRRRIRSGT